MGTPSMPAKASVRSAFATSVRPERLVVALLPFLTGLPLSAESWATLPPIARVAAIAVATAWTLALICFQMLMAETEVVSVAVLKQVHHRLLDHVLGRRSVPHDRPGDGQQPLRIGPHRFLEQGDRIACRLRRL